MKKTIIFLLLTAVLLTGCAKQNQITVDTENQTISDGSFTYEYSDTISGELRIIIIFYPDGGTYTWRQECNISTGSYSDSNRVAQYTQGHLLVSAVLNPVTPNETQPIHWPFILLGAIVAAVGLLQVCFPYKVWDLFLYRWYQEAASNYALTRIIATGLGEIALGVGMILIVIFTG